jgi:hypothetical protein
MFSSGSPFVGCPYWCRLWRITKSVCVVKYYVSLALVLYVYVRRAHLLLHNYIPKLLTSPSIDVTVVTFETQECVLLLPIKTVPGPLLDEENWKIIKINYI